MLPLNHVASAASSDIEAAKGIRIRSVLDGNGGLPPPTDLGRVGVTVPGMRSYRGFSTSYLNEMGRRTGMEVGAGARGAFLAAKTSKEQETDDKEEDCQGKAGNPVVLYTGNKVEHELDFASNGEMGLYLQRTYNHHWSATGLFGRHWLSNFDYSLVYSDAQNILWAQRPDGRRIKFLLDTASGRWYEDKAQPVAYITRDASGVLTLFNEDRGVETYDAEGFMTQRRNEQGVKWTFAYNNRYLQTVTHSSGRKITFGWTNGQLTQVTDPAGGIYRYTYTANAFGSGTARLASTTLPGSPTTTISYHYEDARFPGGFTGKSFNGVRYSTFAYDADRRASLSEHAGGVERYTFGYSVLSTEAVSPPPAPVAPGKPMNGGTEPEAPWCEPRPGGEVCYVPRSLPGGGFVPASMSAGLPVNAVASTTGTKQRPVKIQVTTTNPLGRRTTTAYDDGKQVSVTGDASPRCPASFKEASYDANGYPDLVHDFADNLTDYDYNAKGFMLKRVEAVGSSAARTTQWQWDATTNRLTKMTVPGDHEVTYTYDSRGNVATVTTKNLSTNGQSQQSRVLRFTYTYHSNGLKATVKTDGPLAQDDVTETYNSQGDLASVRNALGHQVTYASYNALGLPRKITGTNGEVTEITYDARGRITSQKQNTGTGWATSSITFDATGNVATVTRPDGVTTRFSYDAARRLMQEVRPMGDGTYAWTYNSYDNASNLTRSEVRHADFPMGSAVTGVIEGINHDANWNWSIGGWACTTGSNSSIDVHAYADNGVALGAFTANQPSEPGVAAACGASGNSYRFDIPITLAQRQQLGGKKLTVYGISPLGGSHNTPLPGSNTHTIPEANVVGNVDGITHDAAWNWYAYGWACSVGSPSAINVELYAEGGVHLGTGAATGSIDPSFNATCQANRSAYWYSVPITLEHRQRYGARRLHAVGVSPQGAAHNKTLGNAGTYSIPAAPILGDVNRVVYDETWNTYLEGWACSMGSSSPIEVHVYVGGAAGSGTYAVSGRANLPSEGEVGSICQSTGGAHRFRILMDYGMRVAHANKSIHVHGISPVGQSNLVISGSGAYTVPAATLAAEFVSFSAEPNNITNGEGTTLVARVRNTGNVIWHENTYLAWGFIHLTDTMSHGTQVKPGEVATFSRFISPENPGNGGRYFEYSAQMASSGAAWGPRSTTGVTVHNTLPICTGRLCEDPRRVTPGVGLDAKEGAR
jgi:YD repeat-containing protein